MPPEDQTQFEERIKHLEDEVNRLVRQSKYRFERDVEFAEGRQITTDNQTGLTIGGSTTEKLGFYGTTPVVQATTSGAEASFTANSGVTVNDNSTWGGYTIGQVVQALQDLGFLA